MIDRTFMQAKDHSFEEESRKKWASFCWQVGLDSKSNLELMRDTQHQTSEMAGLPLPSLPP